MMLSRRRLLGGAVAVAVGGVSAPCRAHNNAGIVDPEGSPPEVRLVLDDDRHGRLRQQLAGRVTAVQMMFTSCQATCPIQGAIFGQAAGQLGDQVKDAQWLSVSIDPVHDDPKALRAWLARFGAHPRWHAGCPEPADLDPFVEFLKARNTGVDRHTAQVYFFNRRAKLVMRSVDFPPAGEIARVLESLSARG
jgi:protein SCO1/2